MDVKDQEEFVGKLEDHVAAALRFKMDALYVDVRQDGSAQSPSDVIEPQVAADFLTVVGHAVRFHAKKWEDVDLARLFEGMGALMRHPPDSPEEFMERAGAIRRDALHQRDA